MASRHDIIHIDFQANAGKANAAIESLRQEAAKAKAEVDRLTRELQQKKAANFPLADIQALEKELAKAKSVHRQWQDALNNNMKGVRALDEAIKIFNSDLNGGKGKVEGMSAALSKAAKNAAELQKSRSKEGSKTWNEMVALSKALEQNILQCNTATNQLISTIKNGGTVSKSTLTQARNDLQQMIALENEGTNAWKKYNSQLTVIEGALAKITAQEQQAAGKNTLAQVFRGDYLTKSRSELEQMIAKLREYQSVIQDPKGSGYRHFAATENALKKLSEQLAKTKGDIASVEQAMKIAGAAGTANRFGAGLSEHSSRVVASYRKVGEQLRQLQQERAKMQNFNVNGIIPGFYDDALKRNEAQITSTTARYEKLRAEISRTTEAGNLNIKQIQQSIQILREQQETVAMGSPAWQKYETSIATLEERMKIMRGEAISLRDAMKISGNAGGLGFTGTAQQLQLAEQAIQKAMNAAKKGSSEWYKYQEALAKVRLEMQNTGMTSERMQAILNKPANAKNLNELQAAVKRAKAELDLMAETIGKNSKAYSDLAAKTKKAEAQLKSMQAQSHATASAFQKAWSRLKTYVGLYVGAAVAMQKVVATLGDLMDLSDKMGEVRKTTGFAADEVGRLSTALAKLDTRTSLNGLMELSAVAGQLGLKTEQDVRGFTEAANMLMVALPEMGKEGATAMLKVALATGEIDKIREQMQYGLVEGSDAVSVAMTKIGSTIDSLRANSAAAAPAITDFVKRVGAVGAQSGITIDQVAALGSTVDALGMRVEMSATALSRMIPAIKNNAFEIAKAIGVTPETIRDLFDAGRGMEAILMIFQHIKDQGLDEDGIEKMMGMGGMADIMKDLNQQGARAGIVFAGLSQNVDELRRQLGVAKTAYEENIAIQNEYNKMNETTAAKWERLKNQVEEAFVSDSAQRRLGWIVDTLRWIVDFLTGRVSPALGVVSALVKGIITAVIAAKLGIGGALQSMIMWIVNIRENLAKLRASFKAFYAENKANVWFALAAAVYAAGRAIYNLTQQTTAAEKAIGDLEQGLATAQREASNLFASLHKGVLRIDELRSSTVKLKEEEAALKDKVEKLGKKLGENAERSEEYKKAQEELSEAHKKVSATEAEVNNETNKRIGLIKEINDNYSKYLGYMLSEASTAETVASAHDLIIAALKEEMYWREKNNAFQTIREQHKEKLSTYTQKSMAELSGLNPMQQQNIMADWQATLSSVQYNAEKGGFILPNGKVFKELTDALGALKDEFRANIASNVGENWAVLKTSDYWGGKIDDGFRDLTKETLKVLKETETLQNTSASAANAAHKQAVKEAKENTKALIAQAQLRGNDVSSKKLAEAIVGISKNFEKYGELAGEKDFKVLAKDTTIKGVANVLLKDLPKETREAVESEMEKVASAGTNPVKPTKQTNPWGSSIPAESTAYNDMTAEQLVARRKQMKDFVNSIQTDTDVKAVLEEDAALKKAIEKGMSSDMRTVIEWYNTERLKIQDELHARYLTNTGDWMDPKKGGKKASKMVQDEMKYYLDELDAYYTERKTMIQEARNDEQISEGEAWRRTLQNEAEWQQRRAELQQLYAKKSVKVTQEEQNAIFEILSERTDGSVEYIKQDIENTVKFIEKVGKEKGKPAMDRIIGDIDLGIEKAFLKQRTAVSKQMDAIADIVNKERPYNGITENLQENLTKMGILQADFEKQRLTLLANRQDTSALDDEYAAEIPKRLSFLLNEAESAYTLTVEELMRRLADKGMQAWADELSKNPTMQQALLAHLRLTYDKIQDAIKKEASLIKKEVDIWWADIAPGADQSRKDGFERILSQLGRLSDSMSHANQLIGAGAWSERVADKLAIKQMEVRLAMQTAYYNKMRQIGEQEIQRLKEAGREEDAEHLQKSLNLAITQEQVKLDEQRVAIANRLEESQNRLYTSLKEWSELIASSIQGVFEASNTGLGEFYTEQAKKRLTGAATSGTYIVVNDAGTKKAEASYETLTDEEVLKIEQRNAQADAWKKMMDDLNMKMSDMITDQINAFLQNASIDANTDALGANTEALLSLTSAMTGGSSTSSAATVADPTVPDTTTETVVQGAQKRVEVTKEANKKITASTQSAFAKMTQAANLYGIAYQAMSNDNMNAAQKFGMIALQTAGNMAMAALTADWSKNSAEVAGSLPAILAKCLKISPIWGSVIFAGLTGLLGGAMGVAAGKIAKSKSEIAQATGAGVQAGRLATGMLTYAEGNVNEFSDPSSLTPGRQYNVDGADGRTYRARYMGKDAKTHITNGPEFHLVGEKGREAIIDAKTTRQIQMNDPEIWRSIQVLYNGGSLSHTGRRGRGVRTFAAGNIDEFDTALDGSSIEGMDMAAMQASLDRNSAATEALVAELAKGIKSTVSPYGKDGIVHGYDRGKAEAKRHGLSYIP